MCTHCQAHSGPQFVYNIRHWDPSPHIYSHPHRFLAFLLSSAKFNSQNLHLSSIFLICCIQLLISIIHHSYCASHRLSRGGLHANCALPILFYIEQKKNCESKNRRGHCSATPYDKYPSLRLSCGTGAATPLYPGS